MLFPIYFFNFLMHFVIVWVHVLIHYVFKKLALNSRLLDWCQNENVNLSILVNDALLI